MTKPATADTIASTDIADSFFGRQSTAIQESNMALVKNDETGGHFENKGQRLGCATEELYPVSW